MPPPEEFDTAHNLDLDDLTLRPQSDLTDQLHHSPIHTCGRKTPSSPQKQAQESYQEQLQRDRIELLGPGQLNNNYFRNAFQLFLTERFSHGPKNSYLVISKKKTCAQQIQL